MAVVTRTITEHTCAANQETHSSSASLPASVKGVKVQLTSSQWATLAGQGRVLWGIALSFDSGVTWGGLNGTETADNPASNTIGGASLSVPAWYYETVEIGTTDRGGNLPSFQITSDMLTPAVGALVRLFAYPEVSIPLGAVATITT